MLEGGQWQGHVQVRRAFGGLAAVLVAAALPWSRGCVGRGQQFKSSCHGRQGARPVQLGGGVLAGGGDEAVHLAEAAEGDDLSLGFGVWVWGLYGV